MANVYMNPVVFPPSIAGTFEPPSFDGYGFEYKGKIYFNKDELPQIDVKEWAKKQGLKISEDGKTLTCYKAVFKENGTYFSIYDGAFKYEVGSFATAEKFDPSRFSECSSGLHGASMSYAYIFGANTFSHYYGSGESLKRAILELKVDISDQDNFVVPYLDPLLCYLEDASERKIIYMQESTKFRFKTCFVEREVTVKEAYVDENTGEIWRKD